MSLGGSRELVRERDLRFVALVRSYFWIATPSYEACRWATQDAINGQWIADLKTMLEVHEEVVSQSLAKLYG